MIFFDGPARRSVQASAVFRGVVVVSALLAVSLMLNACGGSGSSSDKVELIEAFNVVGQGSFAASSPNRGGSVAADTLSQPLGNVATDGTMLFVADTSNNRVLGYSSVPADLGTAADLVFGQASMQTNTAGTGRDHMAFPGAVFIGGGYMVVADSGNNRVLIWNAVPTASNTPPDVVVGQDDFDTSNSATTATRLAYPVAAIVANGRLVVADQNNNRVLIWSAVPTSNGTAADLVLGQPDFTSYGNDDEADEMNRPAGLWSDGFRLLVSDTGNNRVLYWALFPQSIARKADYVIGQSAFSRSTAGTSASTLRTPFGISSDGTSIFVADSGNNRVVEFDSFPIENGTQASAVYGQAYDNFSTNTANDDDQDSSADDSPSARTLSGPSGVYVHNGVLYVSDRSNNRLMMFPVCDCADD
ncbi:hypothetical protein E4T66_01560 [Sinimarinibacterium sp. CAU 1509]|uniref:NHL repeat-containing protein n=1 Tax=Sinimarinibacterium sp. CAU 1509 TaxID=2562283 RepID=UPI0010AD8EE8|nr:NHL repeat-containing protein [Sinimarinibacterium sp. CAU 1509]TJY64941.1 hypothetical protein E4T66_01560 [Sinimarinibacterium sp. CAU 1509]